MLSTLLLTLAPAPLPQEPAPAPPAVESTLEEVTVYGGFALQRRVATLPGPGKFALPGLPYSMDPASLRVRVRGGELVGVETRDRLEKVVPDERIQALRESLHELEREGSALQDRIDVAKALRKHLESLLEQERRAYTGDVESGRPSREAWEANYAFLAEKLAENRTGLRELSWEKEELDREVQAVRLELGRFESAGAKRLRDVWIDVVATSDGSLGVELEFLVHGAGWRPVYDLRAKSDLSSVDLVYRAQVWQRTGEDWEDVQLSLSTAQPQRGAQGPEPRPQWVGIYDPKAPTASRAYRGRAELEALGYSDGDYAVEAAQDAPGTVFAAVESQGLSVQFRLPRLETIESRDQPTDVLVGRAALDVTPEHYVVPALDTTVWLRGRAKNSSEYVLLPGQASVYFGADFVGNAQMQAIQAGEEFVLHLGADPGLKVERHVLVDQEEKPGFMSSRRTLRRGWRIEVENTGAFSPRPDGRVTVLVHEVLPRSRDDRVEVSIERARPSLAGGERWEEEREEKGVLTWTLPVARGGKAQIELETEISFPKDFELNFN